MKTILAFLLAFALAKSSLPQSSPTPAADNKALTHIFEADQSARKGPVADFVVLRRQDEERRRQVHQMVSLGSLHTGGDYFRAALVFQHGDKAEDFLLAHVLAETSLILGNRNARWLFAATLDRYLTRIGRPQIFGTQFEIPKGERPVQLPMDTSLVSDTERTLTCVIPRAQQSARVEKGTFSGTAMVPCL